MKNTIIFLHWLRQNSSGNEKGINVTIKQNRKNKERILGVFIKGTIMNIHQSAHINHKK